MRATWRDVPTTVPTATAALREMGYKARSEELLVVDGEVPGRKLIATLREDGRTWEYAGAWGPGKTSFWGLVTVVKGLDAPAPSTSRQDRTALVWLIVGSACWLALGVLLGVWSW